MARSKTAKRKSAKARKVCIDETKVKKGFSIRQSYRTGIGFGTASGVITTLGLIMGLDTGTHSVAAVLGGIATIAVADAFSDALGIHISEESSSETTDKSVWESTLSTFITKFIIALTFAIPVLLLPLNLAVLACIIWGMLLLGIFSAYVARRKKEDLLHVLAEHWGIAIIVLVATFLVGTYVVSPLFGMVTL